MATLKQFTPKIIVFYCLLALLVGWVCLAQSAMATSYPNYFYVCHGYDCYYRTKVGLTKADKDAIEQAFITWGETSAGEREAIRLAVMIFEERATAIIGVRDDAKMVFGRARQRGQMDCVDESLNTQAFLQALKGAQLLKFHDAGKRQSRGFFIDGRYPHWTATIIDESRIKWAVDSWYEPGGGAPDIMPLKDWKKRGVNGKR